MAGHPLRPATRQCLGGPLPHQLADRPRAHPSPPELSTTIRCLKWSYPVLAPVSGGYPKVKGRLLTCYSPVRRSSTPKGAFPLDLHVLSTPPAFVLSQDQTLQQKPVEQSSQQQKLPKESRTITVPGVNLLGTGFTSTLLSSQKTTTHQNQPTTGQPRGTRSTLLSRTSGVNRYLPVAACLT